MAGLNALVLDGIERLDVGVGLFDSDRRLVRCNQSFRSLRRYPAEVCKPGVTIESLLRYNAERGDFRPGDVDAQIAERVAEITESGTREIEREYRVRAKGGGYRWVHDRGVGVHGNDGRVVRLVGAVRDVTERKRADEALKAALAEFNAVLVRIDYGVLFMVPDPRARIINCAFGRIWNIVQAYVDSTTRIH